MEQSRPRCLTRRKYRQLWDKDWVKEQFKMRTGPQIAARLGCSIHTVYKAAQRFNIKVSEEKPRTYPLLRNREWLISEIAKGYRLREIAAHAGCCVSTVYLALLRTKIRPRDIRPERPLIPQHLLDVALGIHQEKPYKTIAFESGKSPLTIKFYASTLIKRLGCKTQIGVALWVERNLKESRSNETIHSLRSNPAA